MITVTRRLEWDAAHRVLRHESKCSTLHGHRYVALVTCTADELDDCDRVVDFSVVRERVGSWIDAHWDHTTLINKDDFSLRELVERESSDMTGSRIPKRAPFIFDGEPTAETIAEHLAVIAKQMLSDTGVRIVSVEVFETPNCSAKVILP